MEIMLWDKNGGQVAVEESEADAYIEAWPHRELTRERQPTRLGCSKKVARTRFLASRVRGAIRRWARKHGTAIRDAKLAGHDDEKAKAIADAKWGERAPTEKEAADYIVEKYGFPESMQGDD